MSGYGVFTREGDHEGNRSDHEDDRRIGYRSGDGIVDLTAAERSGQLDAGGAFQTGSLDTFLAQGRPEWDRVTAAVRSLTPTVPLAGTRLLLPFTVADYVDFYSSEHHAGNVGRIFRPGEPAVPPNWRHLPIGYHGRSGTMVVSDTSIPRPSGLRGVDDFGPCRRLDIEAEVGFVVGTGSPRNAPISPDDFAEHVFGVFIVNDWSARDIQAFEYRPLGPFLGKSFATSVSPWVVPLSELARVPAPAQEPPVAAYLRETDRFTFDIELTVAINGTVLSRAPFVALYWTPAQQLAHMTVNGASLRTGDVFASGTVSGPDRATTGSLLELTWGGAEPVRLADGTERAFLNDGDEVTISGTARCVDGTVVDLSSVRGRVAPAR